MAVFVTLNHVWNPSILTVQPIDLRTSFPRIHYTYIKPELQELLKAFEDEKQQLREQSADIARQELEKQIAHKAALKAAREEEERCREQEERLLLQKQREELAAKHMKELEEERYERERQGLHPRR